MIEEGKTIIIDCLKCGKNSRAIRYVYENYQVESKCLSCGKVSVIGSIESDHNEAQNDKKNRQKSVENRDRYMRERDEETKRIYKMSLERLETLPDAVANFYDAQEPNFEEKIRLHERKRRNRYSLN